MASAVYETTNVKIGAGNYRFTVSASKIAFDGFMSVYTSEDDEKAENNVLLKSIDESTELSLEKLDEKQHFTQPPAHYTEASLVKTLEELGIGRPSTYSPTITTILARRYIVKENKNIYVTELGEVVNQIMKESFPSIVDEHFTANMESLLDSVGEGTVNWKTVIENFYPDLEKAVEAAEKDLEKVKIEDEVTDVVCDVCGRNMVVKYGPHGKFLACPGFPECRNTKPYLEKIGVKCPKCGKEIVLKKTKKGRKYYGCENNPECDFMSWSRPVEEKCPKCGGYMVMKGSKIVCADEQCGYVTEKKEKIRNNLNILNFLNKCAKIQNVIKNQQKLMGGCQMSVQLLDKTRKINKLLHNNNSSKVVFNDICDVLKDILNSNILVISKKGKSVRNRSDGWCGRDPGADRG